MLQIIKEELLNIVNNIDTGNSTLDYNLQLETIKFLRNLNSNEMSAELSANYLNISRKTFDTYVKNGYIPEGIKESGKTKYWLKGDLDNFKLNK